MTPRQWYTFFMLLSAVVFLAARHFVPKPAGLTALPWWKQAALALAAFVGGALGAKLPFAVVSPAGWWSQSAWIGDGKTVVAGLIGGYLSVETAKRALNVRVKTGDTFAFPLALALAVGRWGCFCNGCCYGVPTTLPWGVRFEMPDGRWANCHPTQLYESIFHLAMAGILLLLLRCRVLPRQHLKLYLICYGVYRFLTEFIRPEPAWWLGLTFYQWAALLLVAGLAVQWQMDQAAPPGEVAPVQDWTTQWESSRAAE